MSNILMSVCQTSDWQKRVSLPYKEPKTTDWTSVERYTTTQVSESDVTKVVKLWVCKESTAILDKYLF